MRLWKKLIIWPCAAIVVFVALFYLINAFDQELDPEIVAFIESSKDQVRPEKNAYFSLLGFNAPSGQEIHAVGIKYADAVDRAYREDPNKAPPDKKKFLDASPLHFKGDTSLLCEHKNPGCLEKYIDNATQIETLPLTNQELIARYYSLYKYQHFRETIALTVQSPIPTYPNDIHKLILGQSALHLRKDRTDLALSLLQQDVRFWRMVLRADEGLISKVVAASYLIRDMLFLSDILRRYDLKKSHLDFVSKILWPLQPEERDMSQSVLSEFRMSVQTYRQIEASYKDEHNIFLHPLFDADATINTTYEQFKNMAAIAALPAHEFVDHLPDRSASRASKNPLYYLYNPIGKILVGIAQPDPTPFVARLHNLDGLIRLVTLQAEIKSKPVKDDDISKFVESAGPDYHNPYTRKPMQWDSEKRTLFFEGIGRKRGKTKIIRVNL